MSGQNVDPQYQAEVLRFDDAQIIAAQRHLASLFGVRLAYNSSGYAAGTVLGVNSVSGLYMAYNDSGSSGENTAVAILEKKVDATDFASTTAQSVSNSVLTHAIFGGVVFYDKLTGIDSAGVTDLKGRKFTDAAGVNLMKF